MIRLIIKIVRKIILFSICIFLFIILGAVVYRFDNYVFYGWEARLRWGKTQFDSKIFQKASYEEKAAMASDLLRSDYLKGQSVETVKKKLGDETGGYYNTETNLTYLIYEKDGTQWDLILIVNTETQSIDYIFAYRRSEGITRTLIYGFIKLFGWMGFNF